MSRISFRKKSNKEIRDELIHPGFDPKFDVVYDAPMISEFENRMCIPENKRLRIQTLVSQDSQWVVGRRAYVEKDIPSNAYLVHDYHEGVSLGYIRADGKNYDVYSLYGILMTDDMNATDLKDGQVVIVDEMVKFKNVDGLVFYPVYADEKSFRADIMKDVNPIKEFFTHECEKHIAKVLESNHEYSVVVRRIPPKED